MPSSSSLDIIIPVRNGGIPLVSTLRALAACGDSGYRLWISDNYSTDGSPWKVALASFPQEVRLLQPPKPMGRVEHWTWAARLAEAGYCKLLLCGDRLPPDHLRVIQKAVEAEPDIIFTPCLSLVFGNTEQELLQNLDLRDQMVRFSGKDYFLQSASVFNLIGPLSAVTFRTSSLLAALPFAMEYGWTADWRLYSQIMKNGTAVRCDATYCVQDRTIARLSSSYRGVIAGLFEERAYQRELRGEKAASKFRQITEVIIPLARHFWRSFVPRSIRRSLSKLFRGIPKAKASQN